MCNGVLPSLFLILMSAPLEINESTRPSSPSQINRIYYFLNYLVEIKCLLPETTAENSSSFILRRTRILFIVAECVPEYANTLYELIPMHKIVNAI